jgi:2',3'-cyclic-nucleotide 2'-phosphodiesterase (5'-nucleotidase family)
VLAVDAGDLLLPVTRFAANPAPGMMPPEAGEIARRARLLIAALARMGVAAFAPGERDLAIGPPLLRRLLADAKVPVVSANLFDAQGRRLFAADRLIEVAGVKIGVFGVIRSAPEDAALWKEWRLEARDPIAAAREEVRALRARGAQLVVALCHLGPYDETKKLLEAVPGIDWAVLAHSGMNLDTPDQVGTARALEAMSMGKDFGRLDLHVIAGDTARFADRGQRGQLAGILADHQRQLGDYRQRARGADKPAMRQYFTERAAATEKSIAQESALLKSQPAAVDGSWFENRILPLDTATADHPAIALLVAQYNQENQRRATAGKPVGITYRSAAIPNGTKTTAAATAPPAVQADPRYAGTVACGGCHAAALKQWQTTAHARALDTLKKKKRDRDPTCVGCHVTGFQRPGGTQDLAIATGRLRDVGCEACHGAGVDHLTAENKKKSIARKVDRSVCLGCHTPDQTNGDFDYPTFVRAILGPGHGGETRSAMAP